MITLAPLKEKAEIEKYFKSKGILTDENSGCLIAQSGGEILGFSLYSLTKDKMTVHYIEPINDIALADGILRSTIHIACENNVYDTFYSESLDEDFLKKIGFIKNSDEKSLDTEKLFKSCRGCK